MGQSWHWDKLCGRGVNFTVWNHGDFGHCFEELAFGCTTHLILLVVSVLHYCRHSKRAIQGPLPQSWTLHFRLLASILLILAPLIFLILTPILHSKLHLSWMDIISSSLRIISWLSQSLFVWKHYRFYHLHLRGPFSLVLSVLLTTASMMIHLHTVILHLMHHSLTISTVEEYITFLSSGFHMIYLLTLIPYNRPALTVEVLNIQGESDALLVPHSQRYGAIDSIAGDGDEDLGVAEDGANCLSKLSFWWVQPLMVKGMKGNLHNSADMFELPKRLRTADIDEKFSAILNHGKRKIQQADIDSTRTNDDAVTISQVQTDTLPEVAVISRQASISQYNGDQLSRVDQNVSVQSDERVTLLAALNRTFGCEYYSLGILKLLADMIGFAGPILLNLLVSYMENKSEPFWHGYLYAGGLFLSTLIGALLSTHFDYQMSVVGFKIRAAIITSVYHKTMAVNSVSLNKFSSGEVVNFMSTDTDRIVNFCPSFHAFWSLPFQIAVSLYLLHQQVGLAFLAGLAFAIILIPINKWLANKIGQLSTKMMLQKDSRVKVYILFSFQVKQLMSHPYLSTFSQVYATNARA